MLRSTQRKERGVSKLCLSVSKYQSLSGGFVSAMSRFFSILARIELSMSRHRMRKIRENVEKGRHYGRSVYRYRLVLRHNLDTVRRFFSLSLCAMFMK